MKKQILKTQLFLFLALLLIISCKKENIKTQSSKLTKMKLSSDLMTPEVLWSFGRIGDVSVSPDGKTVLYTVIYFDIKENKSYNNIYTVSINGENKKQLTSTKVKKYQVIWRPDGEKIAFMKKKDGKLQMWEMNSDGGKLKQITNIKGGIKGYNYSPNLSKLYYLKEVKLKVHGKDIFPDLAKSKAYVIDDHMYRHWDKWIEGYTHIFVAEYSNEIITKGKDIMQGEMWESPVRPFGGIEQVVWTPDSKNLAYVCRKKKGVEYTTSTNTDIYFYNLNNNATINMSKDNKGYDMNPMFSPHGDLMAWESMKRDGYEADKNRLFIVDINTHFKKDFTRKFDQNVSHITWSKDGKNIYFISTIHGTSQIYKLSLKKDKITKITNGRYNYKSILVGENCLIATRQSMSQPTEIYKVDIDTGKAINISNTNKTTLQQLKMGRVEECWIKTTDNKKMLTWIIYPPYFNKTKQYPTLLYCQGGPQIPVSQFWSYRWNFQLMAANGYIIVAPNRRGLPGFGQKWNEQISGDYGGQNMKDYLSAIDVVTKELYIDKNRLGAVGASYGGFSVFWLAGHHKKRFKAFIAHDGIFNLEAMYAETDEVWFPNWDLGGAFWKKNNKIAKRSYANSPHKFVEKWDTPILIVHGGKDFRVSETQSMQAFNSARLRDIPAKFLYFPEENHWVLSAQNGILWQRTFFGWLDKWLKD